MCCIGGTSAPGLALGDKWQDTGMCVPCVSALRQHWTLLCSLPIPKKPVYILAIAHPCLWAETSCLPPPCLRIPLTPEPTDMPLKITPWWGPRQDTEMDQHSWWEGDNIPLHLSLPS